MSTPVGPYSPIVRAGPWLICSGQLGVAPGPDGVPALVDGGPAAQLARAVANAAGLLPDHCLVAHADDPFVVVGPQAWPIGTEGGV